MPRITISYRRDDSLDITGRIFDRLAGHFGREAVFRDIDSIPPGADFRRHINRVLDESDIVLAIVGPRWVGPDDEHRRLANPADPVRVEIETALRKDKPLIPVLVSRAVMPHPEALPDSLQDFAYRNAIQVDSGQDFDVHVGRLIRTMEQILRLGEERAAGHADPAVAAMKAVPPIEPPAPQPLPEVPAPPPIGPLVMADARSAHLPAIVLALIVILGTIIGARLVYLTQQEEQPPQTAAAKAQQEEQARQAAAAKAAEAQRLYGMAAGANDEREALRFLRLAADQGLAYAQSSLGDAYAHVPVMNVPVMNARGTQYSLPQNDGEAAHLYRLAANQGYSDALVKLANFYAQGRGGLPRDDRKAARLYRLAEEKVGQISNWDTVYNEEDRLYRLALHYGEAEATAIIASFYEQGRGGVSRDGGKARELYKLAAVEGNEYARERLKDLGQTW
jgi:hypothetical protein